jgi:hypothetical protein
LNRQQVARHVRLVPFGAGGFQSGLDDLVHFAGLEMLRLCQLALVFGNPA